MATQFSPADPSSLIAQCTECPARVDLRLVPPQQESQPWTWQCPVCRASNVITLTRRLVSVSLRPQLRVLKGVHAEAKAG